jgi:CBS domain-containing protein
MNSLQLVNCTAVEQLAWPVQDHHLSLTSRATTVLTDFSKNRPLVIDASANAVEAEYLMKKAHVRLKIVVDSSNQFLGVVSLADLHNQEIVKHVAEGFTRDELTVSEFMRSKRDLKALSWQKFKDASISSLVRALHTFKEQHVLIVDEDIGEVRGIVSASDIARQLHLAINLNELITFSDVAQNVLTEHTLAIAV